MRGTSRTLAISFLIDEVESHLHPCWQRSIVCSLLTVVDALGPDLGIDVQVLLTTHSPVVLASLESVFEARSDRRWNFELVDGLAWCTG